MIHNHNPIRCIAFTFLLTATTCVITDAALAQGYNWSQEQEARQFIIHMYQEYYQRKPIESEIQNWMQYIRKGDSLKELHASFIGSEEYFRKHNRNESSWLNGVFASVLNRNPQSSEFNYWMRRLAQLNGDRRGMAKEFLRTHSESTSAGSGNWQPDNNLPDQLVNGATQLLQNVNREFTGFSGSVLRLQANNLLQVTQQARSILNNNSARASEKRLALNNVNVAIQGLNSQFQQVSGGSNSRYYLDQINRTYRQLANDLPSGGNTGGPNYPSYNPPGNQGRRLTREEVRTYSRLNNSTISMLRQANSMIRDIARNDYRYVQLNNDTGYLLTEFQNIGNNIYQGYPKAKLQRQLGVCEKHIRNISQRINTSVVDVRVSQTWYLFNKAYNQMAREVGVIEANNPEGGNSGGDSNWDRLQAILQQIDQSIAICDQLIQRYAPFYYRGGAYARMVSNLRNLQSSLVQLRTDLSQNRGNNVFRNDLQKINQQYTYLQQSIGELGTGRSTLNANEFSGLTNKLREISQLPEFR